MEQLVAVMLVVGCSADGVTCTEVPLPTPFYSSIEECRSQLPMQLRFASTNDERLLGACEGVDAAMLEQSATVEWAVSRGGELIVDVKADEVPTVASRPRLEELALASISPS